MTETLSTALERLETAVERLEGAAKASKERGDVAAARSQEIETLRDDLAPRVDNAIAQLEAVLEEG
jgi:phage shock protein A